MLPVRIFIVDDSLVMRTIIGRVVENDPACELVGSAASAETARAGIARLKPDVVTLDIVMPGGGGLQYLDEMRTVTHPAIVVVSASTTAGSLTTARALASGADACFDKAQVVSDADLFIRTLLKAAKTSPAIRH